jgi:hypothetical protein
LRTTSRSETLPRAVRSINPIALDIIALVEIAVHHEASGKVAMEEMEVLQRTAFCRREVLGDGEMEWVALWAHISVQYSKVAMGKTVGRCASQLNVVVSPTGISRPPSLTESIETVSMDIMQLDCAQYEVQNGLEWFE